MTAIDPKRTFVFAHTLAMRRGPPMGFIIFSRRDVAAVNNYKLNDNSRASP